MQHSYHTICPRRDQKKIPAAKPQHRQALKACSQQRAVDLDLEALRNCRQSEESMGSKISSVLPWALQYLVSPRLTRLQPLQVVLTLRCKMLGGHHQITLESHCRPPPRIAESLVQRTRQRKEGTHGAQSCRQSFLPLSLSLSLSLPPALSLYTSEAPSAGKRWDAFPSSRRTT